MATTVSIGDKLLADAKSRAKEGNAAAAASLLMAAIAVDPANAEAFLSFGLLLKQIGHGDAPSCALRAIVCSSGMNERLREAACALLLSFLQGKEPATTRLERRCILGREASNTTGHDHVVHSQEARQGTGLLLVMNAHRQGVPSDLPLVPSLIALQRSLLAARTLRGYVLHPDQLFLETGKPVDSHLDDIVDRLGIATVIVVPPKLEEERWRFVSPTTLERLETSGISTSVLFLDALYPGPRKAFADYVDAARGVVVWDLPERFARPLFPKKIVCSPGAPIDWTTYAPRPHLARDIDVSFVGTVSFFPDRRSALEKLRHLGVPVTIYEGGRLSTEAYVDILQRSRLTINFASHNPIHPPSIVNQIKARTIKGMACGALVMDQATESIRQWFEPFVHYVPYANVDELAEMITHYLSHTEEAVRIARAGQALVRARWAPDAYWSQYLKSFSLA